MAEPLPRAHHRRPATSQLSNHSKTKNPVLTSNQLGPEPLPAQPAQILRQLVYVFHLLWEVASSFARIRNCKSSLDNCFAAFQTRDYKTCAFKT